MSLTTTRDGLLRNPIFAAATDAELTTLARSCTIVNVPAGESVFARGDRVSASYVIVRGVLRLYLRSGSRELTINHLFAPCTFGEVEVVAESIGDEQPGYLVYGEALEALELVRVPAEALLQFLDKNATAARRMLQDVCARFRNTASREQAIFAEIEPRLASLILVYASIGGRRTRHGLEVRVPLTHEILANGLAVTSRSIARVLGQWKQKGWMKRRKGWLVITDEDAMIRACGGWRFRLTYHSPIGDTRGENK